MRLPNQCQPVGRKSALSFGSSEGVYPQRLIAVEEPEPVEARTVTTWYRRNGTIRRQQIVED